jgi:HEAT repeat protein
MNRTGSGSARSAALRLPIAIAIALVPTLGVALRAVAEEDEEKTETVEHARQRVLTAMPGDASALVNVTGRELPASPDILSLGRHGTMALTRCLADNTDASVRGLCAAMLGRIGDRRALPALQAALDDWEPSVRVQVVEALERIPDPSSIDPLIKLFERKDEEDANRAAVLRALGAHAHKKAVALLRSVLADKDDLNNLHPAAFRALWRSRHVMSRETLTGDVAAALGAKNDDLLVAAILGAAELRAPRLTAPLIPLLDNPNANVRNKAVYALGLIGDKAATKTLLAKLPGVRDGRMLNNIAFALERLDRAAFYASVEQLVEHKQAVIRLNAAFVLGDVKRPEGLGMLEKALGDPSDLVKTSVVVAFGKIGEAKEIPRLEKLLEAPNPSLREEAVHAIFAIAGKSRADLLYNTLFAGKKEGPRHRAALALGEIGDTRVRDYLLSCIDAWSCHPWEVDHYLHADKDPRVGGRVLLAWARGRGDLTDLVADLRPAGALPVAASAMDAAFSAPSAPTKRSKPTSVEHAIDLVGALGDAPARARLQDHRTKPDPAMSDPWVELHALAALARLGDKPAETALLARMDQIAADWLPRLAFIAARIEEPDVRARLTPELVKREQGPDVDIALAAASIHLTWDPEAAIARFRDALASPSARERDLADRYLVHARAPKVTWLLRAALAREPRADVKDRIRGVLDRRHPE